MKGTTKRILIQVLIIISFIAISYAYFYPTIEGKVMSQMDVDHVTGIAKESFDCQRNENRTVAWTNSLFGGMPSYQIAGIKRYDIFSRCLRVFTSSIMPYGTVSILFLYLLGFYILLLSFKIDRWISFIGSIAYAFSSYNIIIITAGHITKGYAIGFMPIVIAGFIQLYNKKYWSGSILALLGLGLQLATTHVQIVYYTALLVGLYVLFNLYQSIKEKQIKEFAKASIFALVIVAFAFAPNIQSLWQANEMSKYSIRGKSELTSDNNASKGSGLDKDYALAWSYGVDESFTLLIPNAKGGATGVIGNNPNALSSINSTYKQQIAQQNQYWGDQPFTSGPVYLGAIIMFLFILGMFIVNDKIKWWLLGASIFALMLSWGKNFGLITDIFFDYFPYYNKFRVVSMILVIPALTVPLLAILAIKEIIEDKNILKNNMKYLWFSLGITGGLLLMPFLFGFVSQQEAAYFADLMKQAPAQAEQIKLFIGELETARRTIFKADVFRSLGFIVVAAILLIAFVKTSKLKKYPFIIILGLLFIIDLWTIDRRYLSPDMFKTKSAAKQVFTPSNADKIILKDTDPYYRVLNLSTSTFNDAFTSYFHKSIGGYHGAKLRRYQDIIENNLSTEINILIQSFKDTSMTVDNILPQLNVLNMLNAKYIIYNPNEFPIVNTHSYGNAWFVDNYKFVETPDDAIASLQSENLLRTAIINKNKFDVSKLPEQGFSNDTTRYIKLTRYEPDMLEFESNSQKESFAVFSDIYYPLGWIATVDGTPVDIYQVNYILRGLSIPAGKHNIKFEFKPKSVYLSLKISVVASIIILLFLIFAVYMVFKQNKKNITDKNKSE